jgi:uncharacterized damage-inducible protein DinB
MSITKLYVQTFMEARTRLSNLFVNIKQEDLIKKISGTKNSVGFLIRHIGDVELLFAKNIFGNKIEVKAKTVISQKDTGEWTNLQELLDYQRMAGEALKNIVAQQTDQSWEEIVTTKEFGSKTKAEAIGRIISHTAYHAGQLALALKYG